MDGVPLRVPQSASFQELKYSVSTTVPDYFNILQETEVSVFLSLVFPCLFLLLAVLSVVQCTFFAALL